MAPVLTVSAHGVSAEFGISPDGSEKTVDAIVDWLINFEHADGSTGALDWADGSGNLYGIVRDGAVVDRVATASVVRNVYKLSCPHDLDDGGKSVAGDPESCSWCGADVSADA